MPRSRHPDRSIEAALRQAEGRGWRVEIRRGHAWGRLKCPNPSPECRGGIYCIVSVWSTPRSPENHARALERIVTGCKASPRDRGPSRNE